MVFWRVCKRSCATRDEGGKELCATRIKQLKDPGSVRPMIAKHAGRNRKTAVRYNMGCVGVRLYLGLLQAL